jgi:arginyl-tRNA synthetase
VSAGKEAQGINKMEEILKNLIKRALEDLNISVKEVVLEHPTDLKMGDYSSNIALALAKEQKSNPRELGERIAAELNKNLPKEVAKIEIAGAGFINFYLNKNFFVESIENIISNPNFANNSTKIGQKVMVEYTDPNPFKPFHIGHLMTNAIGESISRIYEASGAEVLRANYQGDVGLHVAKAFYGMQKKGMPEDMTAPVSILAQYIGDSYVLGSKSYEEDAEAKKEIDILNKKIYARNDEEVNQVYDWGFKVTMEAFEELYKILGTQFDYYFLESKVADQGEKVVRENMGKVFEESDGAVVFKAEKYDSKLHTRVFITSQGLPTYETKELGLTETKFTERADLDQSIVVTANEQADYMRVVAKALSLIHPEFEKKMSHITHGMMRFATGKMGSRKGNVITGESLLRDVKALVAEKIKDRGFSEEEKHKVINAVAVAAIKYSILKQSIGGDIIFDFESSISFEGDSGPYLQYSYARARSVIAKSREENVEPAFEMQLAETTELEKMLYRFGEVAERASNENEPHHIANYLIEIARSYNSFYGNNQIVNKEDKTSPYKVALTYAFSIILKKGLHLLGIEAPEKM